MRAHVWEEPESLVLPPPPRRQPLRVPALAAIALLAAGTAARAQTALTPFGLTDRAARNLVLAEMRSNGSTGENRDIVVAVWKAYDRMPPATRASATTAIVAWIKMFVSSAEFKTAYAAERDTRRPEGSADPLSLDEEVKKTIDSQLATLAQYKAGFAALPEGERAKLLAGLSEEEARIRSAENARTIRTMLEANRTQSSSRSASDSAEWAVRYPADPQMWVKQYLQAFLAATDRIDYTLPSFIVKGAGGETLGFLSPGYTGLPWQKIHATLMGKDTVTAARTAADAWLTEIGR